MSSWTTTKPTDAWQSLKHGKAEPPEQSGLQLNLPMLGKAYPPEQSWITAKPFNLSNVKLDYN